MKRSTRTSLARETVEIVEAGRYTSANGRSVDIADAVRGCLAATRLYPPGELRELRDAVLSRPPAHAATAVEVVNETTLAGIARLLAERDDTPAVLVFASAKNPGGGFLNGNEAQEESLARSSALYASQRERRAFYDDHRASPSLLYTDAMILSPGCPVFRDDEGNLLDEPLSAAFVTSPAPNAGAAGDTRPEEVPMVPEVLSRRAELVLALMASQGYRRIVLGAWGCGVFRNDPRQVASAFARHLRGAWAGRFERVVFSVYDTSRDGATLRAFREALG